MRNLLARTHSESGQSGQGLVEYGLVLTIVAVGVIAILGVLGHSVIQLFSLVGGAISSA